MITMITYYNLLWYYTLKYSTCISYKMNTAVISHCFPLPLRFGDCTVVAAVFEATAPLFNSWTALLRSSKLSTSLFRFLQNREAIRWVGCYLWFFLAQQWWYLRPSNNFVINWSKGGTNRLVLRTWRPSPWHHHYQRRTSVVEHLSQNAV